MMEYKCNCGVATDIPGSLICQICIPNDCARCGSDLPPLSFWVLNSGDRFYTHSRTQPHPMKPSVRTGNNVVFDEICENYDVVRICTECAVKCNVDLHNCHMSVSPLDMSLDTPYRISSRQDITFQSWTANVCDPFNPELGKNIRNTYQEVMDVLNQRTDLDRLWCVVEKEIFSWEVSVALIDSQQDVEELLTKWLKTKRVVG